MSHEGMMPHENTYPDDFVIPDPESLTAEEVSARLRLPLSAVCHLAKSGMLRAVQVGETWRFPVGDIASLAESESGAPRVLLVDDDPDTRRLVAESLKARGCRLIEAGSVDEGAAVARQEQFDLLLIDFKMPGKDGTQLVRQLAGRYTLSQMVVITAFPELAKMDELFDIGALTLLGKPLDADRLVECVERILGAPLPEQDSSLTEHAG